jgi:site-specific recombinase XerD
MANDKTTLRFWLRTDRPNKDGSAQVHLVYQIQGQRKYYAIPGIKLFSINWDLVNHKAIYLDRKTAKKINKDFDLNFLLTVSEVAEINAKLQGVINDIADVEKRFKLDKTAFSPQMVIDTLKELKQPETKKDLPGTNLIAFINQFVIDSAGTHKPGTLKVYSGLAVHLSNFEKSRSVKLSFESIDVPMLRSFHSFLAEVKHQTTKLGKDIERNMNNVTAAKQMSTLKTLLNYARTLYKLPVNPDYRDFKVSRKDSEFEVITVTQDEFMAIYNFDFSDNKCLDQQRDVFCFSCATGLRYSDLDQLRREHIRKDNTIRMTASKTGQKLVIPLNPISHSILQKYAGMLKPLPVISNQKTNDYIKEIGELAGIDTPIEKVRTRGVKKISVVFKKYQLLSIHVGRKSFVTLSLQKGAAVQDVMSLSGHTTFKAFKRYVDVNDNQKKTVMATAWGEVPVLKVAK